MAKAQFHKNQRVYVKTVGTWAVVEKVMPYWTKGIEEPIRIFYDVGLGRQFSADELEAEKSVQKIDGIDGEEWRILRTRNKWQSAEETASHPFPGTFPVIVTSDADWGGWRVPGSEYALSPTRIEKQARLMASSPRLAFILRHLVEWAKSSPNDVPETLLELMRQGREVLSYLDDEADSA